MVEEPPPARRKQQHPSGDRDTTPSVVLNGFSYHVKLDHDRIEVKVCTATSTAYIDAMWPHNASAMRFILDRLWSWGLQPIPEEDNPAEVQPDGRVRIYLEEV